MPHIFSLDVKGAWGGGSSQLRVPEGVRKRCMSEVGKVTTFKI